MQEVHRTENRCEQQWQECRQTHPRGIDVEVAGDTCAYAAQLAVVQVAVQTTRNAGVAPLILGLDVALGGLLINLSG